MEFLKKYIFGIRPILRPWFFLVYIFFVPTIIFGLFANIYPEIFPIVKHFYKKVLACQGQILGMALFQVFTSLAIVAFLFFKKSLNDKNLIKFNLKQFFYGIIFASFITLNNLFFGILGTGKSADISFLKEWDFPIYLLLFFVLLTHGINAGIIEEIIFRGVMQGYFRETKGPIYSIFAIAFAFLLPHIYNIITLNVDFFYLIYIFFLSILLSSMREKYNNLSFCFGAHIFGNLFVTLTFLFFAQNKLPMEISRF